MKIFLSHSSRDKALVRDIRRHLPEHIKSWIDEKALLIGTDFKVKIRNVIQEEVDYVIIFLGKEALNSKWVKMELKWALEREKELKREFVLPILLEDVWEKVEPEEFRNKLYLKCFDQEESTVVSLAKKLIEHLFAWLSKNFHQAMQHDPNSLLLKNIKTETEFLNNINLLDITTIYVLGHTGRRIFNALYEKIDDYYEKEKLNLKEKNPELEIKVLIRNPYAENQDRYGQIFDTIRKVKNMKRKANTEIRFYQTLPTFRSIICINKKNKRQSLISTYEWLPRFKSHAFSQIFTLDDSTNGNERHPLVEMVMTWFEHYWGVEEIHTIVFDFDDTIANTMKIQVQAWIETIKKFANSDERIGYIDSAIVKASNNPQKLYQIVKKIFLEKQMAPEIFKTIYPNFPKNKSELKDQINQFRFEKREELTLTNTNLFYGVKNVLKRLQYKFQLVIISSTSENLIEEILNKQGILDYFSIILGKHGPKSKWENIYDKATLLIKLSNLTGIPLDRTVFVGDNNSDFKSAKQLNVEFIEARMVANKEKKYLSKVSLIDYESNDEIKFFNSYNEPTLENYIKNINKRFYKAKFKLDPKFLL